MLTFQRIYMYPQSESELSSSFEIRLSEKLFKRWRLAYHQSMMLHCGLQQVAVECMPVEQENELVLQCSPSLYKALRLPESIIPLHLAYDNSTNQLYLGPILAVLTIDQQKKEQQFGNITEFCEEMSEYAKRNHIFHYVFTIPQWSTSNLTGFVYENKEWQQEYVPIPDVVYNRIGSRKLEQSIVAKQVFDDFRQLGIRMFNDRFLGKWEVYQTLNQFEEIQPHLPDTICLEDEADLATMLSNYSLLFLKPENGSQGRGIFQLELEDGTYKLKSPYLSENQERLFHSLRAVFQALKSRITKRPYLIQQAIALKKLEGRSLDFRLLCARTITGEWDVISAVARVSAATKFVANLSQGGEIYKIDKALDLLFSKEERVQLKAYLYELSIECVRIISKETDGYFGEFGVDIGLDENGFPWIIEINTKPSKNFLPDSLQTIRPSAKTIIQYGYYLADFPFHRTKALKEKDKEDDN